MIDESRGGEAAPVRSRTALVVGANGFLGGYIVAALRRRGWRVFRGMRPAPGRSSADVRDCDLARMRQPGDWDAALEGIDVVVNVAGILRETATQRFETVHVAGPLALARACVQRGIARFVQISALGSPDDGEFIASKHRFDDALLDLPLDAVVLRPSVVYGVSGSYGGTSLLRALAAFPGGLLLPGNGEWPIQPVSVDDLGEITARAAEARCTGLFEVGGPQPMSLRSYQHAWRRWLRIPGSRAIRVPSALVSLQVWIGERLGRGPVGETMWRMLRRGNVTADDAAARLYASFGMAPRPLQDVLDATPSQVQDRWQAQLYLLAPALRIGVILVWLVSAVAGWLTPAAEIVQLTGGTALEAWHPVTLARGAAIFNLLLAVWLATDWRPRPAIGLMAASVAVYTFVFGAAMPALWLDPPGGLVKNLVVLPALAVLWVLVDRR